MKTLEEFAKIRNLPMTVAEYITRNKSFLCRCSDFKLIYKSPQSRVGHCLSRTCGNPMCSLQYGRKRPEHSKFMSELAKSGKNKKYAAALIKPGELRNKMVNSLDFKNKVLLKNGIIAGDVEKEYSVLLATRNRNSANRRKQLLSRYEKWELEYRELVNMICGRIPTQEWVESLDDETFLNYWKRVHGVNTIRNIANSNNVGRSLKFHGEYLSELKFNTKGITKLRTRSSWEANLIKLFEKEKVKWSYEEFRLETLDKLGFYVPDFVATVNGKTYMIEIKGGFFAQDKKWYIKNKIGAGIRFCKEKGWAFSLMYQNPKNLEFLKSTILGD